MLLGVYSVHKCTHLQVYQKMLKKKTLPVLAISENNELNLVKKLIAE
jgi:hypothetical protein